MFQKKTVKDVPLEGQRVLVRADYNVPLNKDGTIADDFRIRASLPTLRYLLRQNCTIVICSHLGRPEGKPNAAESLEPIAQALANLLKKEVSFIPDCIGDRVKQTIKRLPPRSIVLLENLRFHPGEASNDSGFARKLVEDSGARYFVQDGFGVVHRANASTEAITQFIPSVAGLLLKKEVTTLAKVRDNPSRPLVAILGGAKISDKIELVERFIDSADKVLIGGAMANTFLAWEGWPVGQSLIEPDSFDVVSRIATKLNSDEPDRKKQLRTNNKLVLPIDVAVATSIDAQAERRKSKLEDVAHDDKILDIGDATIEHFVAQLEGAHTVLWNGTMGMAEYPAFAHGSARIALQLATHPEVESVVGGGDTADFVLHWDSNGGKSFHHVSTGGGASLDFLSGKELPGVLALM